MINSIFDVVSYATGFNYAKDDPFLISGYYRYASRDFLSTTLNLFESDKCYGINTHTDGKTYPEFVWGTSYGLSGPNEPKINEIKFGDGFSQRIPDGINNNLLKFNVLIDSCRYQKSLGILHFLDARQGCKPFLFTPPPPYATKKLFICKRWESKFNFADNYTITAEFEEVPV